jgi:hypothetical protein
MAVSQWKLTRMEVGEAAIFREAASAATQVPLLDRLWQCQCRLERSYARAQRELERLQNSRRHQVQQPEEAVPAPNEVASAPGTVVPAPQPAAEVPSATCTAASESQLTQNVPSQNIPRLISTAPPMAEQSVSPAQWPSAAASPSDVTSPHIEPVRRAAS